LLDNQRITGVKNRRKQTCATINSRMCIASRHHHCKGRLFFFIYKIFEQKSFRGADFWLFVELFLFLISGFWQ